MGRLPQTPLKAKKGKNLVWATPLQTEIRGSQIIEGRTGNAFAALKTQLGEKDDEKTQRRRRNNIEFVKRGGWMPTEPTEEKRMKD